MKRKVTAVLLGGAFALSVTAPAAFAQAEKFGPGAGTGGGVQKCHPPGQTKTEPGCK